MSAASRAAFVLMERGAAEPSRRAGRVKRLAAVLGRRRGTIHADVFLRGSVALALLAIYVALRWPAIAPLLGFFLVTLFVNGPLGPLLPSAYEPVLIMMGRVYSPLLVAAVGITGVVLVDWLNYYLYRAMLSHPVLEGTRRSWPMRQAARLFDRAPFLTVWVCALGMLPHVAVRVLAPLARYPVRRYLLATFLGRAPRLWLFAALGNVVPVSTRLLMMVTVTMIVMALVMVVRHAPARRGPARATPGST